MGSDPLESGPKHKSVGPMSRRAPEPPFPVRVKTMNQAPQLITKISRLLMLDFGTAVMSEDMKKDGYEYIMNIDFSSVAIYMMEKKNEHVPQLEYMQMNVTDMSFFSDESFDSAIDKAQPGFEIRSTSSPKSILEPVPLMEEGLPPPAFMLENPASCYVYVCEKGEAACLPTDS